MSERKKASLFLKVIEAINELEKLHIGKKDMIILAPPREMTTLLKEMSEMELTHGSSPLCQGYKEPIKLYGVPIICEQIEKLVVRSMVYEGKRIEVEHND